MEQKKFPAKIMLFGEYSIIRDSMALALPYPAFSGYLTPGTSADPDLKATAEYLRRLSNEDHQKQKPMPLEDYFDLPAFMKDVEEGIIFCSTIPAGQGLGSSGALCASLYHRYGKIMRHPLDVGQMTLAQISLLKALFSQIESYFHGSSSGLDPLISYLQCPLLIRDKNHLGPISVPDYKKGEGCLFLLSTGRSRKTGPLVEIFMKKTETPKFAKLCQTVLLPITNGLIHSFLEKNTEALFEFFREISDFQFRHFSPMIPEDYQKLWREGLKSEKYYLKLCGAGGGGYLLGMTKDFQNASEVMHGQNLEPLFWF